MNPDIVIRPLTRPDSPAALALSTAVGWNQTQADWQRMMALHPEGVLGAWRGNHLLGTATLVSYVGEVAWLGMVIVSPDERGQGIGSLLVDAALNSAELPANAVIGLDATEFGAPLYERKGFETVAQIDRWAGILQPVEAESMRVSRALPTDLEQIASLDRFACGVDRSRLLEAFLSETDTVVMAVQDDGVVHAYGVLRAGLTRSHVGPLVAPDSATLGAVISGLAGHAGNEPVYLDAVRLPGRTALLESFGLSVSRTLLRMARPSQLVMSGNSVVAATAFEWG